METMLGRLAGLWRAGELCDVELVAGGRVFHAHRCVLAAVSSYFHGMFCGHLREAREPRVVLHQMDGDAIEALLHFIYTGVLALTDETAGATLAAAEMLCLETVSEACCRHLQARLKPDSAVATLMLADVFQRSTLRAHALTCARRHFAALLEEPETRDSLLELPEHLLRLLLESSSLCLTSEDSVLQTLVVWASRQPDPENGGGGGGGGPAALARLLPLVRSARLSADCVARVQEQFPALRETVAQWFLASAAAPVAAADQGARGPPMLYVLGGTEDSGSLSSVLSYDIGSQTWRMAPQGMIVKRRHATAVEADWDRSVYVMGGIDDLLSPVTAVERLSTDTGVWTMVAPLPVALTGMQSACMHGRIYVSGGSSNIGQSTTFAYVYHPAQDIWTRIADMNGVLPGRKETKEKRRRKRKEKKRKEKKIKEKKRKEKKRKEKKRKEKKRIFLQSRVAFMLWRQWMAHSMSLAVGVAVGALHPWSAGTRKRFFPCSFLLPLVYFLLLPIPLCCF
jgi:hypothetical protein